MVDRLYGQHAFDGHISDARSIRGSVQLDVLTINVSIALITYLVLECISQLVMRRRGTQQWDASNTCEENVLMPGANRVTHWILIINHRVHQNFNIAAFCGGEPPNAEHPYWSLVVTGCVPATTRRTSDGTVPTPLPNTKFLLVSCVSVTEFKSAPNNGHCLITDVWKPTTLDITYSTGDTFLIKGLTHYSQNTSWNLQIRQLWKYVHGPRTQNGLEQQWYQINLSCCRSGLSVCSSGQKEASRHPGRTLSPGCLVFPTITSAMIMCSCMNIMSYSSQMMKPCIPMASWAMLFACWTTFLIRHLNNSFPGSRPGRRVLALSITTKHLPPSSPNPLLKVFGESLALGHFNDAWWTYWRRLMVVFILYTWTWKNKNKL